MVYKYKIRLRFYINNYYIIKDYIVLFNEVLDFLTYHFNKNSTCEIFSIKPYYDKYSID